MSSPASCAWRPLVASGALSRVAPARARERRPPVRWSRHGGFDGTWPRSRPVAGDDAARPGGLPVSRARDPRAVFLRARDGDGVGDGALSPDVAPGASVRTADPTSSDVAPASSADLTPPPSSPPKRRRGRPKGTRKVTGAPVPGDAMGVASLLWRLSSDDEALNGKARIQPHGIEAVVPRRRPSTRDPPPPSSSPLEKDEENADELDRDHPDDATSDENESSESFVSALETSTSDDSDSDANANANAASPPPYRRRRRHDPTDEDRVERASRHSGVVRSRSTRRKISASNRSRWAAARERATADRAREVAATISAMRRGAAETAAKAAAREGEKLAKDAAAADDAFRAGSGSSPWEALAAGAGMDDDAREAGDAAERAAAFAALLNGGVSASTDDGDDSGGGGGGGGSVGGGAGSLAEHSEDEDDDEELRATKAKMREQLAALARRRAEITGAGAPSAVTVAKFTAELARFKRLRGDLEEWSNAFYLKHGRRPTTQDVERTGIDFLVENFKEYVRLRDKLMSQTPYLRGQMEDVARDTLPKPMRSSSGTSGTSGAGSSSSPGPGSRLPSAASASASAARANANAASNPQTFKPLKMSDAALGAAEEAMKRAAAYRNKNRSDSAAERRGGAGSGSGSKPGTGPSAGAGAVGRVASAGLRGGVGAGDAAGEAMRRAAAYKSGKASSSNAAGGAPVSKEAGAAAKEAMRRAAEYKKNAGAGSASAAKPPGKPHAAASTPSPIAPSSNGAGAAAMAAKEAMKRAAAYKAERDGK